jgi:MoxR-like ATPase
MVWISYSPHPTTTNPSESISGLPPAARSRWLQLSPNEPPLNPRIVGEPGLGKTTLACAAAHRLGRSVYLFQCTMDTRPEDLVITPVLTPDRRVDYHASS